MVPANQSGENLINNFLKPNLIKQEEQKLKKKQKKLLNF
jgi:branched-chain amino acid transport system ATP-binding protein